MDLNRYCVAIGRGEGLVARAGDVVMFIADVSASAAPLLRAIEWAAAAQSPGRVLAKKLGAIALGPDSGQMPSFGMLAPTGAGLLLMLRGQVVADIDAEGARRVLAGDRALTWVDEIVREPADKIVIGRDVSGLTVCPYTDLRAGVVPGGGFVVQRVAAAHPATPATPVAEQLEPETRLEPSRGPAAVPSRAAPAPAAHELRAPDKPIRKPAPSTAIAEPVLGSLAAENNAVYPLDRPYVIGRNPLIDKSVHDALASPIVVPDDPEVSRVHAYITIEAGAVLVRDAGTPGGTYLARPGDATWIRVGDRPTEIKPGWCLRIGQRILVYQKASSAQ